MPDPVVLGISIAVLSKVTEGVMAWYGKYAFGTAVNQNTVAEDLAALREQKSRELAVSLLRHQVEVSDWSLTLDVVGSPHQRVSERKYVDLKRLSAMRRANNERANHVQSVEELLSLNRHALIVGDAGAGKTTALKHLARLALHDRSSGDPPIVIRVRLAELSAGVSLAEHILGLLDQGFAVDARPAGNDGARFMSLLAQVLNSHKSFLLLDGFDEVAAGSRKSLQLEVVQLARKLDGCHVVISSRIGSDEPAVTQSDYFERFEIADLDDLQVEQIAQTWLETGSTEFLDSLRARRLLHLARRPLTLTYMCALQANGKPLPDSEGALYRSVVSHFTETWDHQRGLARDSEFFKSRTKAQFFLEDFALGVALLFQRRSFSTSEARDVCAAGSISARHSMHIAQVLREVESHTGFIVKLDEDEFSFSHESMYEYLASSSLKRRLNVNPADFPEHFERIPGIVGAAVVAASAAPEVVKAVVKAIVKKDGLILFAFIPVFFAAANRFLSSATAEMIAKDSVAVERLLVLSALAFSERGSDQLLLVFEGSVDSGVQLLTRSELRSAVDARLNACEVKTSSHVELNVSLEEAKSLGLSQRRLTIPVYEISRRTVPGESGVVAIEVGLRGAGELVSLAEGRLAGSAVK